MERYDPDPSVEPIGDFDRYDPERDRFRDVPRVPCEYPGGCDRLSWPGDAYCLTHGRQYLELCIAAEFDLGEDSPFDADPFDLPF